MILGVGHGGLVVLVRGGHAAARKPLIQALLEGHAPSDTETPCVRVCFTPSELLDAPVGARVVLVGAEREPEWLNLHRPVIRERKLVLVLWTSKNGLQVLRRHAPDFLDWVSHRIEVPPFAPEEAMAEFDHALARVKWVAVAGAELLAAVAMNRHDLDAAQHYRTLVDTMDRGDVLVRGLKHDDQLWRLLVAHAEARWQHHVVLVEPRVLPPFAWIVDARLPDWEQRARRLQSLGVEHARLAAVLETRHGEQSQAPLGRGIPIDGAHMDLLGRVARAQIDHETSRLARNLGLHDVAEWLGATS